MYLRIQVRGGLVLVPLALDAPLSLASDPSAASAAASAAAAATASASTAFASASTATASLSVPWAVDSVGFVALILLWSVAVAAQGPALAAVAQEMAPAGT